jgi:hypothetical protein
MDKAVIHLLGFQFAEPSTFISDLVVAIFSIIFYLKLMKIKSQHFSHNYWQLFFLFMGISAFIGGFGHLLSIYTGKALLVVSWIFSAFAIYFIEFTSISILVTRSIKKTLQIFVLFQLILCTAALIYYQDFFYIKISTTIGLIGIVLIIQLVSCILTRNSSGYYLISGIILIILTSLIHYLKLSFNKWFNYNDISHIILVISLFLFYKGSLKSNTPTFYLKKTEVDLSENKIINELF